MRTDWILDVLADLRTFASSNDLPALAEQLDDTAIVALTEIAALKERTDGQAYGDRNATGANTGVAGASGHA